MAAGRSRKIAERTIESLGRSLMRFDLERMRRVLAALGHPEARFPTVHIAGSNGKGSVTALLSAALEEAGHRVAMYTSPHLERLNERFRINGREMSDADLARLTGRLTAALAKAPLAGDPLLTGRPAGEDVPARLTQFEFLTALAFLWFAEKNVDVAVVETGLGGRLDATNTLEKKLLTVITNISLEHTEWLGKTVSRIAAEKAGILRPGVPVVTGADGAALRVIRRTARKLRAPLTVVRSDRRVPASLRRKPPLPGAYQRANLAVAYEAAVRLAQAGFSLSRRQIETGFRRARWPGRFETFSLRRGKRTIPVVLDGAHNPAGAAELAASLRKARAARVHLVFGALKDKDVASMVRALGPLAESVVLTPVPSSRTAEPGDLARLSGWRRPPAVESSPWRAWTRAVRLAQGRPIVVAGSLYLVGEIRRRLKPVKGKS